MLQVQDKLVAEEIFHERFCCNLAACKGACCVEGEGGAPLAPDELGIMEEILPRVRPFLSEAGRQAIVRSGPFVRAEDGAWETPLVQGRECAYLTFEDEGVAKCGIEKAFEAGAIAFQKPISCHLYPIRVLDMQGFQVLKYHRWGICQGGRQLGAELGLPLYKFLEKPLARAFGAPFMEALNAVAEARESQPSPK